MSCRYPVRGLGIVFGIVVMIATMVACDHHHHSDGPPKEPSQPTPDPEHKPDLRITGFGAVSYELALRAAAHHLAAQSAQRG